MEPPLSMVSSSSRDSAPLVHPPLLSSSSFSSTYDHRHCTSNRRVVKKSSKRRMEPSHRAAREMAELHEQQQRLHLDYTQPINFVGVVVANGPQAGGQPMNDPAFVPQAAGGYNGGVPMGGQRVNVGFANYTVQPEGHLGHPLNNAFLPNHAGIITGGQPSFDVRFAPQPGYQPGVQNGGFYPPQVGGHPMGAQPVNGVTYTPHPHQPVNQYVRPPGRVPRMLPALPPGIPPPIPPFNPHSGRHNSTDSAISMTLPQAPRLKQIGLYTLHERIGDGMFGAVRRATHNVTKTEVAIKMIKKSSLRPHIDSLIRVYKEIEVQKRLAHPFILDIFQVMETESTIYLVTELCPGGELFHKIHRRGRLPEILARKYFSQLLSAVGYLHERGVVHRDIKAENVLIDEYGNAKLADFGFAQFYTPDRMLTTYCGSPQYAAPEIFSSAQYDGAKVDIWCMGVILHVFLTGCTPFEGNSFDEIKNRVLNDPIEYPFYVSPEAAQLLNLMMNRNVPARASIRQIAGHRWLKHDEMPKAIVNAMTIYNYIHDNIPKDLSKDCLNVFGIKEKQLGERAGRYDNVDGMNRLLVMEYKARRLRKVYKDNETMNIFVAALVLQTEDRCRRSSIVTPIEGAPLQAMLDQRHQSVYLDDSHGQPWRSYLPHPEGYPYRQFKEEQRKEAEEIARSALLQQQQTAFRQEQGSSKEFAEEEAAMETVEDSQESSEASETIRVETPAPSQAPRSAENANPDEEAPEAPEAQEPQEIQEVQEAHEVPYDQADQPAPVEKTEGSADSSEGYGGTGETSTLSTVSTSQTSIAVPLELRRMPSDVCNRMDALDLTQKRRGGSATQAPLPKRPSLPECLGAERGSLRLADPPKHSTERKSFFELMRLKRSKKRRDENEQSTSRPDWSLPPPPLPEGGSFDDTEEGRTAPIA